MGRWEFSTTPFGVLALQTNTKTGKSKGVQKSGQKVAARVWCPRRKRQMHLGSFDTDGEAAAAIANAEKTGPENLPTPKPRKPRTSKAGTPAMCHARLPFD